jgi:hypothetical protein
MVKLEEEMLVYPVVDFVINFLFSLLQKSIGKISFTTDCWSDPNQASFMAVTAHWIEAIEESTPTVLKKKLQLRTDPIGFYKIPGQHTGEHLAHCFMFIIDRLKLASKVSVTLCIF